MHEDWKQIKDIQIFKSTFKKFLLWGVKNCDRIQTIHGFLMLILCGSSSWEGNKQHFNTNFNHSLAKKGSSKPTTKSFGYLNIFSWLIEQRKVLQQACKHL
jgi:hypothetical protein